MATVASPIASVGGIPPDQLGAVAGLGGRQLMLVYRVQLTVPPANVSPSTVMTASVENSSTLRTVARENLSKVPDRIRTDIDPKDKDAIDLAMYDAIQENTYGNPGDWKSTKNADGTVTYTSKYGSTITGHMEGQVLVLDKKAGIVTDTAATNVEQPSLPNKEVFTQPSVATTSQTSNQQAAAPATNVPKGVLMPGDAQLAINNAMASYFSNLTHNIKGDVDKNGNAVAPVVQQAVALMYTTMLDSLIKARLVGTGLLAMTPIQKDQYISRLLQQSKGLTPLYNNFINLQNQVENVPGTVEGIRNQYAKFKAQAAQLAAQGKQAEANALLDNINGSLYDRYVKAREKFYNALAQNPILGIQLGDQQFFQAIQQSTNTAQSFELFDKAAQSYVDQLQGQIDRIAQMENLSDLMELGGPMYAGAQATAAASGGDFTKGLINALQGTWDGTEGVYKYEKGKNDAIIAALSALPIVGLPFAAVQIYQEGNEYFMAVGTEADMKALMGVNGAGGVIEAQDIRDSAGNKFTMSVALAPAQIPQFMAALKLGKVGITKLKGLKLPGTAPVNAGNEVRAATAASGAVDETAAATKVSGAGLSPEAAADAAATQKLSAFLNKQAQLGGVQEVQAEINAARQAGMSETQIAALTEGFDAKGLAIANRTIAEDLMKARLQHLGYDLNMPRSDFNRIQQLSVRSYGQGLSQSDVAWLQGKIDADPNYLNKLTKSGYVTEWTANPFAKGSQMPQEGFISALPDSSDVAKLQDAFVKGGGKLPPVDPSLTAGTVKLPPGAVSDATVKLPPGAQDPTVKLPAGSQDPTVRLGPNDPTVRIGQGATDPTVKLPAGSQAGNTTAPTTRLPINQQQLQQIQQLGMMAFSAARGGGRAGTVPQMRMTALGNSSGDAFTVQVVNTAPTPLTLVDEGIIVEPIVGAATVQDVAWTVPPGAQTGETTVEGFCVERVKQPPAQGQQYRVAAPEIQTRFAPLTKVLQAASKVQSLGLLHPDSNPIGYFNSIRQWAIWTKQDNFDEKRFTEEFLNHTKKNVEASNVKWSKDMEQAVRKVSPNRWNDIQQVLQEANKGKAPGQAAAPPQHPAMIAVLPRRPSVRG